MSAGSQEEVEDDQDEPEVLRLIGKVQPKVRGHAPMCNDENLRVRALETIPLSP